VNTEQEEQPIIPTRHKSKFPRTLSYPIGAKAISVGLLGAPQFDDLTVEDQRFDPRWRITVHAVPRSLRHEIQAKVLAEALPAIGLWLLSNPHASDRKGSHGVGFTFDELKNELISGEKVSTLWLTEKADR